MILFEEFKLLSLEEKNLEILKCLPGILTLGDDLFQVVKQTLVIERFKFMFYNLNPVGLVQDFLLT